MGLIPFARNAFCPVAADEAHRLSVVECYEFRAINEQLFGATYLLSEDSDKLVSVESSWTLSLSRRNRGYHAN